MPVRSEAVIKNAETAP